MPITGADFDRYMAEAEAEEKERARTRSSGGGGKGSWAGVFEKHPEGGGPFGGRNNAAIRFVGFLRAKSFPYEAGQNFARDWNHRHCIPPIPDSEMEDIVSRAWASWIEGGHEDQTPEDFAQKPDAATPLEFLTFADMEREEAKTGGMNWVVEGGIPMQGLVYLTGAPAGGKSWVALDLMRAVVQGGLWIGKYPVAPGKALYIDEEMGVRKALPRMRKLGIGAAESGKFLYTNKAGLKLTNPVHLNSVRDLVGQGYTLILVDTLTRVHDWDENDNSQMRRLFTLIQVWINAGATVVILHHDRKGGQGVSSVGHDRSRGAGEIMAAADMVFGIEKSSGGYKLVPTKSRLLADDEVIACDFVIEDNEERSRTTLRVIDASEKSDRIVDTVGKRVMEVLFAESPLTQAALIEAVGGKESAVVAAAERLVEAGEVVVERGSRGAKMYKPSPF